MTGVRTWLDGVERPVSGTEWATRLLTCLGGAFRVVVPAERPDDAAWWWARDRAREVAARCGAPFDEAPWIAPGAADVGWEVHGVWEHRFRAPWGSAATRVTALPVPGSTHVRARAVVLPFPYGSRSALAGLPVPQPHLDTAAARHLAEVDATGRTVGLWVDHAGEVCTSTVGPLLVETARGEWFHPRPEAGGVPTWGWHQLVMARNSRPVRLEMTDLADARVHAVGGDGVVTILTPRPSSASRQS